MRHHQARLGQPFVAIQNQIEVQCSRGPGRRPPAPILALDLQQPVQQRSRRQAGVADDDPIQVARLIADADRRGVEPGGATEVGKQAGQPVDREGEMRFAIAEIAPEGDRDRGARRYCPVQRAPMTMPL